jgi:hypothetical protein
LRLWLLSIHSNLLYTLFSIFSRCDCTALLSLPGSVRALLPVLQFDTGQARKDEVI